MLSIKQPAVWLLLLGVGQTAAGSGAAWAQQPVSDLADRVLVVVNQRSSASKRVAAHYMAARGIPAASRCPVKPPDSDQDPDGTNQVQLEDYERKLKPDIRRCLERVGRDKVLYMVLSYDMPYRLFGTAEGHGTALDSYLADIWDQVASRARPTNPYYAEVHSKANSFPGFLSLANFRNQALEPLIYSVWRLDGPTPAIASRLVDQAIAAEKSGLSGQACFDRRFDPLPESDGGSGQGDWDLFRAAELARAAGLPVLEDAHGEEFGTPPAPLRCERAILYSGWYSLNHYNDAFSWNPGAIGWHLDSASAANPREGRNWSANALERGITITSGAVDEPFLQGLPRPAGVVHDLLQGANVGDAFFRNTEWIRWQIVNIGDPLYRPFASLRPAAATSR